MIGRTIGATLVLMTLSSAALAQIQQLPSESRGEAQVNSLNSQMGQQQQIRGIEQQSTINNNRTQMQIQTAPQPVQVTPPVVVPARR